MARDERALLLSRLALIVKKISRRDDLEVMTDESRVPPGQEETWFTMTETDPEDRDRVLRTWVHIPSRILEASEDIAKGKAAHEAGHVAITRHGSFIPDEVLHEPGFHALASSVEERPTDRVVAERYPGAGAWLEAARRDSVRQALEAVGEARRPGEIPEFFKLCDLIVYRPYLGSLDGVALAVRDAYDEIEAPLLRLERTLPAEDAPESEIRQAAIERYRILYEEIWPKARRLFSEDLRRECERRVLRASPASGGRGARAVPSARPSLEALPEGQRQRLEEAALVALAEIESAVVAERDGGLDSLRPESRGEFESRREREREESRLREELGEIATRQAVLAAPGPYEEAYRSVRHLDEELTRELEEIFRPTSAERSRRTATGARLVLSAVFRRDAARRAGASRTDDRIFSTRNLPGKRDFSITLLVDLSGSMSVEGRIEETFKAVVLFTEVLSRLGIPHEILGFQDDLIVFKEWDDELGAAVRGRLSGMLAEVRNSNPGGHNQAAFNDDGPCLLAASEHLKGQASSRKLLLVLSDGIPAGRRSGEAELREAVRSILSTTDQILVGLGLGPGTDHVADFYPIALPGIRAEELPERLAALLVDVLGSPER